MVLALGAVLTATVVPGVFSVDEDNYLVTAISLRQGGVTLANTAGLPPSRELRFFDPGPWEQPVRSTPVTSTAPPLYAPVAVLFLGLGWRGLVAINTLAYLFTAVILVWYVRRYASGAVTPWLAAGAFAVGGFAIEYAQGVWPHALSIALCAGGVALAGRAMDDGRTTVAALAGFVLALAAGVRYQNAVILVAVGISLAAWGARRWRTALAFGLAAALPLLASAAINHARLGSWNPVSKGPGYLHVPVTGEAASVLTPAVMFWARTVDFSVRPPLKGRYISWVHHDPQTGAHLMLGETLQKAFLQSAPWAILGFALFFAAWVPRFSLPEDQRRQLRMMSLIAAALLGALSLSGPTRHDGLAFNQRYLLELLPLAAAAFAFAMDRWPLRPATVGAGVLWGVLPAIFFLSGMPEGPLRLLALLKFPLFMAATLGFLWILARRRESVRPLVAGVAGACLGWAVTLHVADDLAASRRVRAWKLTETRALQDAVPDRSALVTYWGGKDAAGPLLLDRDVVILDTHADEGQDAPMLIGELLRQGRRVFVIQTGFPPQVLERVFNGWDRTLMIRPGASLVELRQRSNPTR